MASKWDKIKARKVGNDRARESRNQKRRAIIKFETALFDLRQGRGVSQEELAEKLNMGQRNVSRIEHGENPTLSTLAEYIAGLGGRIEIHAVFPEDDVVVASFAKAKRTP